MRKHDVRKWLHAILDLLPVILIPVFMVYSHRHDVTENVEINYKYQSNEVNNYNDLVEGNIYHFNYNGYGDEMALPTSYEIELKLLKVYQYNFVNCDFNIDSTSWSSIFEDSDIIINLYFDRGLDANLNVFLNNDEALFITYGTFDSEFLLNAEVQIIYLSYTTYGENLCNEMNYTDYNVIESVDTTNTNVMDSFMNKFNTTIDKYFNMGNVFNLNGVYQWFNTNIFSGNAPTIIYSIWNIALYELVMDLLFLLYCLFMWFIDMVQTLMDKPFKSIK